MNTRLTIAVALVGGLFGGLLTRYIAPPVAFAQDQTPAAKEIRTQSLTLVDSLDRTVGTFTSEPIPGRAFMVIPKPGAPVSPDAPQQAAPPVRVTTQMRIVLRDPNGREIWSAGDGVRMLPALSAK